MLGRWSRPRWCCWPRWRYCWRLPRWWCCWLRSHCCWSGFVGSRLGVVGAAPAAVAVAWPYGLPTRLSGRAVVCGQSASDLRADGHHNLGEDLVDELQVRPPNANHLPARPLKVSLATLLGLDRVVYLADGLPVLDAAIWPRCGMRTISVRPSRGWPPQLGRGPRR